MTNTIDTKTAPYAALILRVSMGLQFRTHGLLYRSEERRVGLECISLWSTYH